MARPSEGIVNAFSVDVEEYFQVSGFAAHVDRDSWVRIPTRLEIGLEKILEIAAHHGVIGTFYFLGWIAERYPGIVQEVVDAGHEVGCHSAEHRLAYEMDPSAFRDDLRRALDAIESAAGRRCRLYRAPSFSITSESLWALQVLAEEGIDVDSSVYPIRHDRYGLAGAPRWPYRPLVDQAHFVEFPPAAARFLGVNVPFGGGGYLRLYPLLFTRWLIRWINAREKRPVMLYVHPWELDSRQPALPGGVLTRWRHRVNLGTTGPKLNRLFSEFRFSSVSAVLENLGGAKALPTFALAQPPAPVRDSGRTS
ncbi:MAG: DUF3473 domain-containing protein [Acidobacteriota bacterium]|nr:MAG: DUF3473 domain-containing protein [Acidobacteriota bacterium]